jgi:hypothetical protein
MKTAKPTAVTTVKPTAEETFWTCWSVFQVIHQLPKEPDKAREVLRIVNKTMALSHGDRWNYTAEEYAKYLKGKNPHGLKVRPPSAPARRRKKP